MKKIKNKFEIHFSDEKDENIKINYGEEEIKKKLNSNNDNNYYKYGLLNKNWYDNYKNTLNNYLIKNEKIDKNIYNINSLFPKFEKNNINYNNNIFSLSYPNNFIIVKEKIIYIIKKHFKDNDRKEFENLIFDVIIGGKCIIIKDNKNENINYIYLYNDKNKNLNNNEIDYILIYNNQELMLNELHYISNYNFENYLKKIDHQKEEEKIIFNSENKSFIKIIIDNHFFKNENKFEKSNNIDIPKINPFFNSILLCLYQFKDFINELNKYYKEEKNEKIKPFVIYFQNPQKNQIIKFNEIFNNISETKSFKDIIKKIFNILHSELVKNKKKQLHEFDQVNKYNEEEEKKKFIK